MPGEGIADRASVVVLPPVADSPDVIGRDGGYGEKLVIARAHRDRVSRRAREVIVHPSAAVVTPDQGRGGALVVVAPDRTDGPDVACCGPRYAKQFAVRSNIGRIGDRPVAAVPV